MDNNLMSFSSGCNVTCTFLVSWHNQLDFTAFKIAATSHFQRLLLIYFKLVTRSNVEDVAAQCQSHKLVDIWDCKVLQRSRVCPMQLVICQKTKKLLKYYCSRWQEARCKIHKGNVQLYTLLILDSPLLTHIRREQYTTQTTPGFGFLLFSFVFFLTFLFFCGIIFFLCTYIL